MRTEVLFVVEDYYAHMNKTLSAVNTEMICKKIHLLAARAELKAAI